MSSFIHTDADLAAGMAALVAQDPRLAPCWRRPACRALRRRDGRLRGAVPHRLRPAALDRQRRRDLGPLCRRRSIRSIMTRVRRSRADKLARLGLSRPKIKSMKAIGAAIAKGQIDLDAVGRMEADQAHAALTALHGIGPWTADIYLLFCLGNADAWPAGDLALQEAARIAFDLKQRPDAKEMVEARGAVAAVARGGRASALGLLSRREAARRRAGRGQTSRDRQRP